MSDDKEVFTAGTRSGKASIATMGGAAAAFQYVSWNAIQMIAEIKGTADLTWLDELHQASLAEVKSTVTEGVAIEVEAEGLQFGVDVLDAAFKAYRARLIKAGDK
jgi:CheY-specific phosphatase CheX